MTGSSKTDEDGWSTLIAWDVGEALSPLPCCAVAMGQMDFGTSFPRCPLVLEYGRQGQHYYGAPAGVDPFVGALLGERGDYVGSWTTKEFVRLRCTRHDVSLPIKPNMEFMQALLDASVALAREKERHA